MTINGKGRTAQAQSVFCTKPDEGSAARRVQEYFCRVYSVFGFSESQTQVYFH